MTSLRLLAQKGWRALTSMGTALVLLFLLALGAVPGALLPQRSLNASKVDQYLGQHPTIGPWLDRLQMFDVFSSFWFTAIYVLLVISLISRQSRWTVFFEGRVPMKARPVFGE